MARYSGGTVLGCTVFGGIFTVNTHKQTQSHTYINKEKTSQNLTILLSKFKKTNEQLMEIVMKCDQDNEMAVDMWEQVSFYYRINLNINVQLK